MRLTSPSVQRLLNASERTLVASASAAAVKGLTLSRLRSKITRVRRLKDKYVDVARARRQAERGRAPRSRGSGSRIDAETATRKAAIFDDVLNRFTAQLQKLEAKAQREVDPATRKARARKVVARVKRRVAEHEGQPAPEEAVADEGSAEVEELAATNTRRRAVSHASKAARVARRLDASHVTRAQSHVGSRTQRSQARRDSND